VESGPDATFGSGAGRKLPNKLGARQDAERVCAIDGEEHHNGRFARKSCNRPPKDPF